MDRLCAELNAAGSDPIAATEPAADGRAPWSGALGTDDDLFVIRLRGDLARIAGALGQVAPDFSHPLIVQMVLDGAEMMIRGEILKASGNACRRCCWILLFLVALPIVDQDRALALSQRASELIAETLGD